MIALNELLNQREKYEETYKAMGLKENLNSIVELESKRKKLQLKAEELRAKNNRDCANIAKLRKGNLDTTSAMHDILETEKEIKSLQKDLSFMEKCINSKLKKLHNLPDSLNELNLQIDTKGNKSNFTEFTSLLKSFMNSYNSLHTTTGYVKKLKMRVFDESELPICVFSRNGILILVPDYDLDKTLKKLFNYFNENAMNVVQLSFKNLKKSSTAEYLIQFNEKQIIKLELKREFYTRQYKLKYKNKSLDMTKFVNQIDIMYL